MEGPIDTPYEGEIFYVELFVTKSYPMKPPKVRFITRFIMKMYINWKGYV